MADLDKVRDILRRLFWQMNDESGGLVWQAPELIGEIIVNVPILIPEYAGLLLSFLREEPFERGTHFAIYRVAQINADPFVDRLSELVNSVSNPDPAIQAYSALALGTMKEQDFRRVLKPLLKDHSQLQHYDVRCGDFVTMTVGEAARMAINFKDKVA